MYATLFSHLWRSHSFEYNAEKRIEISYDRPSIDAIIHRIVYRPSRWRHCIPMSRPTFIYLDMKMNEARVIYLINLNLPTQISIRSIVRHYSVFTDHRTQLQRVFPPWILEASQYGFGERIEGEQKSRYPFEVLESSAREQPAPSRIKTVR